MFQYAAGRAVSLRQGVPLLLDLSFYKDVHDRAFRLNELNVSARIATEEEIEKVHSPSRKFLDLFRFKEHIIREQSPWFEIRRVFSTKKEFSFDKRISSAADNTYLDGHWTSERYFKDIEEKLRIEFRLRNPLSDQSADLVRVIRNSDNPVSVHVRHGDYISNQKFATIHGTLTKEYYSKAIEAVEKNVKNPRYFVFSDNIEWARENLPLGETAEFISDPRISDTETIYLMSICSAHIIANSSFSWWGAWLDANPNKMVAAPKNWFADKSKDTTDLIPPSWIKI